MARDKGPKSKTFGVADGFDFSSDVSEQEEPKSINTPSSGKKTESSHKDPPKVKAQDSTGSNPYYKYHPKKGAKGGTLGAPRKEKHKTQISIGCTLEDKELYQQAAIKDGRKLPDFVNTAIKEYIATHNLT